MKVRWPHFSASGDKRKDPMTGVGSLRLLWAKTEKVLHGAVRIDGVERLAGAGGEHVDAVLALDDDRPSALLRFRTEHLVGVEGDRQLDLAEHRDVGTGV